MNVWVCDISGGILGYVQFFGGLVSIDGIVVDYQYFGIIGMVMVLFDLGCIVMYEVGYYFNLCYIWGDGNCNVDDQVGDMFWVGGFNYIGGVCFYLGLNSCNEGVGDLFDMF